MINDNTILSSFDDKPTLLEWLKKVEDALKSDTATAVSVENPTANTYVFKITFADGTTLSSGNVVFPDSVKDVSIKNGHIIVTSVGGNVEDLGVLNPYADTIVVNAQTNDVEINKETKINAGLEVLNEINCDNIVAKGAIQTDSDLSVTGNAQVNGRLQVNSSIISNGEIRGGNISGTKFLLGTEEMPLVKANPTGEATATLEKVKIGDVAYKVGGSENDKELTLILPYPRTSNYSSKYVTIEDENVWNKLTNYYYETIKIYYNDGYPLGVFHVLDYYDYNGSFRKGYSTIVQKVKGSDSSDWYGKRTSYYYTIRLSLTSSDGVHNVGYYNGEYFYNYDLDKAKFDALYKLAEKPTQDGNYILKASVSGGAVTYTWELQQ